MYSVDFALRSRRFGRVSATYLIDDAQIDRCDDLCEEPTSYGLTVAAEGFPLIGNHRGFASYRRVANLTYRTNASSLSWTSYGLSLGEPFSDFDETRAGVDIAAVPQATLRLYAAYRRQGEGDYRTPFPTPDQYDTTPVFLAGSVRQISRVGLTSAGSAGALNYSADAGFNRTAKRLTAGPQTSFEGRVRFRYHPRWVLTLRPALDD
jgi:hypothetical protein